MQALVRLFEEYLVRAVVMTEEILAQDVDAGRIEAFTANRERLLSILDQMSRDIDWESVAPEIRSEANRTIEYLKTLDERLLEKLRLHQQDVRREIEATFKQKENIKGYNLSDVK